ncbi:hypothetical protein [Spiroplasma endosymbiont of Eupeodes luniger]|uniref:hypothetical protein n=1 Tax=Spiroplasma endosymbiont of Eupeodes luniger TaxID=3066300 RepID=UPI0030D2AF78
MFTNNKKPLQMDISNYDAIVKAIFDFDIKPFRDAKVWTESYNAGWKFWNSGLKIVFNKQTVQATKEVLRFKNVSSYSDIKNTLTIFFSKYNNLQQLIKNHSQNFHIIQKAFKDFLIVLFDIFPQDKNIGMKLAEDYWPFLSDYTPNIANLFLKEQVSSIMKVLNQINNVFNMLNSIFFLGIPTVILGAIYKLASSFFINMIKTDQGKGVYFFIRLYIYPEGFEPL